MRLKKKYELGLLEMIIILFLFVFIVYKVSYSIGRYIGTIENTEKVNNRN